MDRAKRASGTAGLKKTPAIRVQPRSEMARGARDRPLPGPPAELRNVAPLERMLSVVIGGALGIQGVRRGGIGGAATALLGGVLAHRGITGRCFVYDALGVRHARTTPWLRKQHGDAAVLEASDAVRVEDTVRISAPAPALYRYWRDPDRLVEVLRHLQGNTAAAFGASDDGDDWPADLAVEIINDIPDRLVAWKTRSGAAIPSAGSVHLDPSADQASTDVRIVLEYLPPGGPFGALLLRLVNGDPAPRLHRDLSRFRSMMERRHSTGPAAPRAR